MQWSDIYDRIQGGLFGVAVGDALGATTEFMSKESIEEIHGTLRDIVGGGYWQVEAGETTDDTAMMIAVCKGILANPEYPLDAIGSEFLQWADSEPKDIGNIVRSALFHYEMTGNWGEAAKRAHETMFGQTAGNGSLMRTLPVALVYTNSIDIRKWSIAQSKMTHFDEMASECCNIYTRIAHDLLNGKVLRDSIEQHIAGTMFETILSCEPEVAPDGYVVHTLKWALYALLTCDTFEDVVVYCANLGGDTDTISAIAGGLAGIHYGYHAIPNRFRSRLLLKRELCELAGLVFEERMMMFQKTTKKDE